MFVFVYGTLKRTHSNHHILASSRFVTTATVRGFKLYNCGFPVSAENKDTVITGEVFDIGNPETEQTKRVIQRLDSLESYHADQMDRSMYHRIKATAYGDDNNNYNVDLYLGNPKFWGGYQGLKVCPYDSNTNSYTWSR